MDFESSFAMDRHVREVIADRLAQAARDAEARQFRASIRQFRRPRLASLRLVPPLVRHLFAVLRLWRGNKGVTVT
ncbi:MAG: hypothetical protein ACR2JY_08065 [Chloroflexota bacterium]